MDTTLLGQAQRQRPVHKTKSVRAFLIKITEDSSM